MDHPPLTSRHLTAQHCSQLRHKGMYVYSETNDPGEDTDGISATAYWCGCTQKAFGPDGAPVGARHCTAERACCDH